MKDDLTERQVQVVKLLETGATTKQIARLLTISEHTARNHIQSILIAMGAHTRLEAVWLWRKYDDPAERIFRYCTHAGIYLNPDQKATITGLFKPSRTPRG